MGKSIRRAAMLAAMASAVGITGLSGASAETQAQRTASYAALARLPDWDRGVWQIDWSSLFGPGARKSRPEQPSLTPPYAAKYAAYKASQAKGDNVQPENANCVPPGMPEIMSEPYPLEFIYSPGRVTIAIETDSQVRRIYTDGRKHPSDPDDTFNGDSIGHWEGQDLVVDTIAIEPHVMMAPGIPHSDQEHIVERFHQVGPDRLDITTTITDPKVLTKPWSVTRPYLRHADWHIEEYVCEQNNHDSAGPQGQAGISLKDTYNAPPAAH